MRNNDEKVNFKELYGVDYIDKKMPGYYSGPVKNKQSSKLLETAWDHVTEKFSIDLVVKEIAFAFIAFSVLIYMQYSGRVKSLDEFGLLIQCVLAFACIYNLFKASIHSLFPGLLCMSFGGFLTLYQSKLKFFKFITPDMVNIIIGIGALFIALSLIKGNKK